MQFCIKTLLVECAIQILILCNVCSDVSVDTFVDAFGDKCVVTFGSCKESTCTHFVDMFVDTLVDLLLVVFMLDN